MSASPPKADFLCASAMSVMFLLIQLILTVMRPTGVFR